MTDDFIARIKALYENERSYTLGRAAGEARDVREIRAATVIRALNERTRDDQIVALVQHAVDAIGVKSDKVFLPRFQEDGSLALRLDGILRVGENLVVAVVFATEDDWAAYLAIKRENAERQMRNWRGTEQGISRIIAGLRSYGQRSGNARPVTLDALPFLFPGKSSEDVA